MTIRFEHGGAYLSGIRELRGRIRANATLATIHAVPVSHPGTPNGFTFYLNLAYQANDKLAPANASLYGIGFTNANAPAAPAGTLPGWRFNLADLAGLPAVALPGGIDGSYGALGHANALDDISDDRLLADVKRLAAYAGGPVDKDLKDSLADIIVAVCEAARFDPVAQGIDAVLGKKTTYAPPLATLRAWGGHTLGS